MNNNSWGQATWAFLHTLSVKIKPEHFNLNKNNLIELVKSICFLLPCEDCSHHAFILLSNYNYSKIKTLKDFQIWIWEFHNIINLKLNKPEKPFTFIHNYKQNNLHTLLKFWNTKFYLAVTTPYLLKRSTEIRVLRMKVNDFINNNSYLFL